MGLGGRELNSIFEFKKFILKLKSLLKGHEIQYF